MQNNRDMEFYIISLTNMAKKEKGKKKKSYQDGKLKITIEGPASAFERLRPGKGRKKDRKTPRVKVVHR